MQSLLKSFAALLWTLVLAGIVAAKLDDMFPQMDRTAWGLLGLGFAVWIFVAVRLDAWVEKLWPNRFTEDQVMWISILATLVVGGLLVAVGWGIIGGWLAPHFGAANLN